MGRRLSFDPDAALDRAVVVFWRHGYDGASLSELTAAMGLQRPSLYSVFGNKQQLFERAVERYRRGLAGYLDRALAEPTARRAAHAVLEGAADLHTAPDGPPGCLTVSGALACGAESAEAQKILTAVRLADEARIRVRMQRARDEGDLPPDSVPAMLASHLRTVTYGMAVQAASGATREQLQASITLTMAAWPSD
jgi:AcrR family transcriptional regulator